jgi:hypothetical protein
MEPKPMTFKEASTSIGDNHTNSKYQITLYHRDKRFNTSITCTRLQLSELETKLKKVLADTTSHAILKVSEEKANAIVQNYKQDPLCRDCDLKLSQNCVTCYLILQSPLERKLFLELKRAKLQFKTQFAIDKDGYPTIATGRQYDNSEFNYKDVLTIADFYIQSGSTKLCIYTDGYTFHAMNKEQDAKDKAIDRKLQQFGYVVLRYTGKEVNTNINNIIDDIKTWLPKNYS